MEIPLFAQVAVGVALGLAVWAGAKWVWANRAEVQADLKRLRDVLAKLSFFIAFTLAAAIYPYPLSTWVGWAQLVFCGVAAFAWGGLAIGVLLSWREGSVVGVAYGFVLLAVALVPALNFVLHLPELWALFLQLNGLEDDWARLNGA